MRKQKGMALELPARTEKPRAFGISLISDVGVPVSELEMILRDYHSLLDIAKLGIGSAYVTPNLEEKLRKYAEYDVPVYFGGTLFEKYYHQSKVDDYIAFLKEMGINWIEISHGTIDISINELQGIIGSACDGMNVIAEIGKKNADIVPNPDEWLDQIQRMLNAGCRYVTLEGRSTANAGLYTPDGDLRKELVMQIVGKVDRRRLIFEASTPKSQMELVNLLGSNINLGNVNPRELLLLETERQALRSETFLLPEEGAKQVPTSRRNLA